MSESLPSWLKGVLPVLPTPFTAADEVDYEAIPLLVSFAAACGVQTVVTPAFGSEFYKLDVAERQRVIETVVECSQRSGLQVVVQCNHITPRLASRLAADAGTLGAAAVSTALPRAFACGNQALLEYSRRVCDATDLPVIVQDWNPGGTTADADFFIQLHQNCSNFRMAKLEEPGIAATVRNIIEGTAGQVGVLSGWGGSYALQLHASGVAGLMPGLATADAFARIWEHLEHLRHDAALEDFSVISPYLQFSLQNFEQFHHAEKHLLCRRGAMRNPAVRPVTFEPDSDSRAYLERLVDRLCELLPQPACQGNDDRMK